MGIIGALSGGVRCFFTAMRNLLSVLVVGYIGYHFTAMRNILSEALKQFFFQIVK